MSAAPPRSFLLIESDRHITRLICVNLTVRGCEVRNVATLNEGRRLLVVWHPSTILIELPYAMDKYATFLHELEAEPLFQDIPLVTLSTEAHSLPELQAINHNVTGMITLPFTPVMLLAALHI